MRRPRSPSWSATWSRLWQAREERKRTVHCIRVLRLQLALILFQREKGRPARTLDELTPGIFAELPLDPDTGRPFDYRLGGNDQAPHIAPGEGVILHGRACGNHRIFVPRLR